MRIPLFVSSSAVADASGSAILRFSPGTAGASWSIERMVTSITGAGVSPRDLLELVVYRNVISEANRLDHTSSAAQDTSEIPNPIGIASSDTVIAVYSGIPTGASCQFTITGYADTGRI
jgi:hypothetical protein